MGSLIEPNRHSLKTTDFVQPSFTHGKADAPRGGDFDKVAEPGQPGSVPEPLALCLSTPRVSILHQQVKGQQEELQARSTELGSALVKMQVEADQWQARFCQLEEEHQAASASLAELRKQCEVRPGGPRTAGGAPWAESLGLGRVQMGPRWRPCSETVCECHPEAEGKPEAFEGDEHPDCQGCVRKHLSSDLGFCRVGRCVETAESCSCPSCCCALCPVLPGVLSLSSHDDPVSGAPVLVLLEWCLGTQFD